MKINRHNTAGNRYLNEDGTFEAFPYSYTIGTTKNGNNMMGINYRIRTDVQQAHQGEIVDYSDSYTDSEVGEQYINTLIVNAGVSESELPDGQNLGLPAIAKALMGKPVRITNKRKPGFKDPSKMVNDISFTEPSKAPSISPAELGQNIKGDVSTNAGVNQTTSTGTSRPAPTVPQPASDPFTNSGNGIDISDDDLPF